LYDDIAARDPVSFKHFWEQPHLFDVEGAETFYQLQERAVGAVSEMLKQFVSRKVAIVSHGALIKSLLCHFQRRPMSELWAPPSMHNCAHSIVELNADGSGHIIQYADQASSEE
jgi:probable phosphoglycerate mutase